MSCNVDKIELIEKHLKQKDYKELDEIYKKDKQRPVYHFATYGWMNDINGLLFYKERYHLFFQHNPYKAKAENMSWGHASSTDMLHWKYHPVVIAPQEGTNDSIGCYSGNVFINDDGIPVIIYHAVQSGTSLAYPKDPDDPYLIEWEKYEGNPVIKVPRPSWEQFSMYDVHDTSRPWKTEDGMWNVLTGSRTPMTFRNHYKDGDKTFLFRSKDLKEWKFEGQFYESDRKWTTKEEDCSVQDFFKLQDKHCLLFSSHVYGTQCYVGEYIFNRCIYADNKFIPESHTRLCYPGGFAAGSIEGKSKDGETVLLSWIFDQRLKKEESGWCGMMSLPAVLYLDSQSRLCMQPHKNIDLLKKNKKEINDVYVQDNTTICDGMKGECIALEVDVKKHAEKCGIIVRSSGDGLEETMIYYNRRECRLKIDCGRSSLDRRIDYKKYPISGKEKRQVDQFSLKIQEAPLVLDKGEKLNLKIFIDRTLIEVFANNRVYMTQQVFPTLPESQNIYMFSLDGESIFENISFWDMVF